MADGTKEKRLALNDAKAARHTLARVIRMRFRGELESDVYRDLVYGLHTMLGFDKLEKESALEKRLAGLENKRGSFVLNVTSQEMDGLDYTPEERDMRILELLQKAGYTEPPQADIVPAPVPVPAVSLPVTEPPQQEQPQPRRLKL